MGARIVLLGGSVCLVAAALVIQACGSTEEVTTPGADSGADVVDSGQRDAVTEAETDAGSCDKSADFTTKIPDASIADGASTSGICLGCTNAKCKKQVDDCNQNCGCQEVADEALACYLRNTSNPFVCAAEVNGAGADDETRNIAVALIGCISNACKEECATDAFTDAGPKDAGDAGDAN